MGVDELATEIVEQAVDGLTLSGGEPFAQAPAVLRLVRTIRAARDLSILSYTGYTLDWLRRRGSGSQQELLSELDILIDGPYVPARHASLRWRGSANQRIHALTRRHESDLVGPDNSAGLQIEITPAGMAQWLGVPPVPGFRNLLEAATGLQHERSERNSPE